MSLDQDLGERIRSAREAHGWTQDQLAEALGVAKRTVGNWERGRPPKQHLGAIERLLNTRLRGAPADPTDDGPTVRRAEDAELLGEVASRLAASSSSSSPTAAAMTEPTTLADYVRGRMTELGLTTLRDLQSRTGLALETGRRVLDGRGVSEVTLKRISDGLGLPLPRLRELAGQPRGEAEPFELPIRANQLNDRQRRAIVELIDSFLDGYGPTSPD